MCGGLGFIIGLIVYFGWRDRIGWRQMLAHFALFWMLISVLFYLYVLLA